MNPIWYERVDEELWINPAMSRRWGQRLEAGAPVTLIMMSPHNMWRWAEIQGVVLEKTEAGGEEHIDRLSQRYLGSDYVNHQDDDPRLVVRVAPTPNRHRSRHDEHPGRASGPGRIGMGSVSPR